MSEISQKLVNKVIRVWRAKLLPGKSHPRFQELAGKLNISTEQLTHICQTHNLFHRDPSPPTSVGQPVHSSSNLNATEKGTPPTELQSSTNTQISSIEARLSLLEKENAELKASIAERKDRDGVVVLDKAQSDLLASMGCEMPMSSTGGGYGYISYELTPMAWNLFFSASTSAIEIMKQKVEVSELEVKNVKSVLVAERIDKRTNWKRKKQRKPKRVTPANGVKKVTKERKKPKPRATQLEVLKPMGLKWCGVDRPRFRKRKQIDYRV